MLPQGLEGIRGGSCGTHLGLMWNSGPRIHRPRSSSCRRFRAPIRRSHESGNPVAFVALLEGFQRHWIPASAGMTRLFPIAATLRVLLLDACAVPLAPTSSFPRRRESIGVLTVAKWIPASAGMTRLFPIAATLRVWLLDIRVTC